MEDTERDDIGNGENTDADTNGAHNENSTEITKHTEKDGPMTVIKEEEEERPFTSNKRLPSQNGRPSFLRTPGGDPSADDRSHFNENNEKNIQNQNGKADILITELREEDNEKESKSDTESDIDEQEISLRNVAPYEPPDDDDDDGWDTDLEIEEDSKTPHDPTYRTQYTKLCEQLGVVPVSYFTRHMVDKVIIMRSHGLGVQGTRAIARVLRDVISLEKLDLEGNWMEGEGGKALSKTLEENEYIHDVSMAKNKLGSQGAYYVAKMLLVNTNLRKLNISGNEFQNKDAAGLADAMEKNTTLRELNLSHNFFGEEAGEVLGPAIGANEYLDVLDLSWNNIRRRGAVAVAKGLAENVILKTCNLSWNGFGPEGGAAIADAIANNSSLLELDISGNRLTCDVAVKIGKALKKNETLTVLKMGNNPISTSGCIAIVTDLSNSEGSVLSHIDLSEIPVEFEFLKIVEELKQKRKIEILHGPILSSGNTAEDIGKRAVDPRRKKDPLLVLQEHVVINDSRLVSMLQKYDVDHSLSVSADDFVAVLEELQVPFDRKQLQLIVDKLDKTENGRINYGKFVENASRATPQVPVV
ncbi:leucine-rich repeat-containing protein 74B-like [Lingula anatina]|uniref:Leucine-rich repeat-containing protein 74B-like n=1 Tax=Lingula anatina TaxID=7574 RepID=A0A1S3K5K4_LINAN|nr:leucine-rich repeat-containing protein 74B-like [Lingula anatina]|eukprot:XP_013417709.1 leucine-rich repeat-containing protein 74B-like [Lingula anatina]